MQIDEFLKLVRTRRSIRQFKPDPIPDEYIEKILEAGRWAMSGANGQPWEFIVVKEQETKNKIVNAWLEARNEGYAIEQTRIEELRHNQLVHLPASPSLNVAPVLIVVVGDRRTLQASVLSASFTNVEVGGLYQKNMANATQNLCLAAAALGLGAQWNSVNRVWEQPIKDLLGVPNLLDIHTIIAIGYPAYKPAPPYRRKLKEIVHHEKYDRSKYRSGDDIIKFVHELRSRTRSAYRPQHPDLSSD